MTCTFSRQEFEAALPKGRWWALPQSTFTEYSYEIEVSPHTQVEPLCKIYICSSIRHGDLFCGGAGENSIRAWLVDLAGRPVAPKLAKHKYVARTKGWEGRLNHLLRELYKIGLNLGPCKRPGCGGQRQVFKRKDGPDKGRLFYSCSNFRDVQNKCDVFKWVDEVMS